MKKKIKLDSRLRGNDIKEKPLVSVIIPVFNGTPYLEETVNSVQKSTFRDFEIILIDDGSTDKSREMCKKLENKYNNVRFFAFKKNRGLGNVLNYALIKARGKLISRLNQDDLMKTNRLKLQTDFFKKNPEIVALGSYIKIFTKNGKTEIIKYLKTDRQIKRVWHIVGPFYDSSVMYRKETALKAGGYDEGFWPADDTHLFYRLGLLGKLANIDRPLVDVRFHDHAASIKHFRILALSTYKMHIWADQNIGKAPQLVKIYWMIQLLAGLILSPYLNWAVYRSVKKAVYALNSFALLLRRLKIKRAAVKKVIPQPIALSRSGQ